MRAIARVWTGTPKNEERLAKLYRVKPRTLRIVARRGGNRRAKKVRGRWTPAELAMLRAKYPDTRTDRLARQMGRTACAVFGAANVHGLHKSREFMARLAADSKLAKYGARYRFKKGQVPPNKGRKMPPGWAPGRMRETQFRKGVANHNLAPVGAEREIDGILYRKVSDVMYVPYTVNWKPVHHLLWEKHHGKPVPPRHVLRFRDGDRRNFGIGNLELLTHAENMRRNSIHRYPPELRSLIRLQAKLERTIEKRAAA